MVRHILATSLTTEYNLFFAFARCLCPQRVIGCSGRITTQHRSKRRKSRFCFTSRLERKRKTCCCRADRAGHVPNVSAAAGFLTGCAQESPLPSTLFTPKRWRERQRKETLPSYGSSRTEFTPTPPNHNFFTSSCVHRFFLWTQPFVLRAPPSESVQPRRTLQDRLRRPPA